MATIRIYDGTTFIDVEVTEEFAAQYAAMEKADELSERRETRRNQSLDKSMEHGFDVADPSVNVSEEVERRELSEQIKSALHKLTDKQRTVFLLHALDGLFFREIGEQLGLSRYTVWDYYDHAVKKLQKFFQNIPPKPNFRGY